MCLNSKKTNQDLSQEFLGNKSNINKKKDFWEKPLVTMIIKYVQSKAEDWQLLTVD